MSKQNNHPGYLNEFKEKSLVTLGVMTRNEMVLGIPAKIFAAGILLTGTFIYGFNTVFGLLMGGFYYYIMSRLHQKDPQAFEIGRHVFFRLITNKFSRWSVGKSKSTRFIMLKTGL